MILGGALIATGPFLTTSAFYRDEMGVVSQRIGGANLTSLYSAEAAALNQAEMVVLLEAILTPIGGAMLAYGLSTGKNREMVARLDYDETGRDERKAEDESSIPAKPS